MSHAVAVAVGDDGVAVVEEPVEHADGGGVFGQESSPGFEGPVGSEAEGSAFVAGGDEPEQELGSGVVQRREAEFIDQDQVVAEQAVDEFPDGVVGESAVEGFDEFGGGEVADPVAVFDGGDAQPDRVWDLPVPAGPIRQTFSAARIHSKDAR